MEQTEKPEIIEAQTIYILYTNWEGKTAVRHIFPIKMWFGHTEWHPDDQWLLTAWDLDKDAERTYAKADIHQWSQNKIDSPE
jgi:hypothetical protein